MFEEEKLITSETNDCENACDLTKGAKILMVVTNTDHFDEHHKTGVWFEEFAVPYLAFLNEGYFVTVASLKGGKAPLDPASENLIDNIKWNSAKKALEDTTPLESIDYTFYDAIVLPGGHGPMFDLAKSELIGEIVSNFDKKNKIIAAVCHGPAGLLTAEKDGSPFVNNRLLTAFTNEEEIEDKKDKLTPFMLEDALIERGAVFKNGGIGAVNVIEDGNLITGQNFQSAELFASTIIRRLKNRE